MEHAAASSGRERALAVHGRRVPLFEGGAGRPLLYDHPLRVAEELAMLDGISGGRIIAGMVVGLGVEDARPRGAGGQTP